MSVTLQRAGLRGVTTEPERNVLEHVSGKEQTVHRTQVGHESNTHTHVHTHACTHTQTRTHTQGMYIPAHRYIALCGSKAVSLQLLQVSDLQKNGPHFCTNQFPLPNTSIPTSHNINTHCSPLPYTKVPTSIHTGPTSMLAHCTGILAHHSLVTYRTMQKIKWPPCPFQS